MKTSMKTGKFPIRSMKKRPKLIIAIVVFFVLGTAVSAVFLRAKNARAKNPQKSIVQSAAVTKGSISNTIDASGNLEVSESIDITVPVGIKVDEIKVESGEKVTKGQTLAKLNKTSVTRLLVEVKDNLESIEDELDKSGLSSLEKEQLNGEKSELEETEETLAALYKKPVITALADGIIGTINISENAETSNNAASTSSGNSSEQGNNSTSQMSTESTLSGSLGLLFLTADVQADNSEDNSKDNPEDNSETEPQLKTVTDYSELSIQTPVTGEAPQKNIPETSMYTGTISWDLSGSVFQSGTVYTATIVLTAKSGYTFSEENLPIIKDASFHWNIYSSGEGNTLKITAKYEKTSDAQNEQDASSDGASSDNSSDNNSGDLANNSGNTNSTSGNKSKNTSGTANDDMTGSKSGSSAGSISGSKSGGSAGSMAGSKSGSSSGSTASSASSAKNDSGTASDSSSEYGAYETVAFTIAKQDNVKIVVNVDELDILSVEKDQSATVTLDALEEEQYTGTVTKISNTASAGTGSTKYEVEITVPMDENMLIGMSASAAIQVSNAEDTLILPMTALQQRGDETFVYTQKDADGNLSGETAVETGLSDGQNVEITSGLHEGDEVYYTRAASDKEEGFNEGFGFSGGMGDGSGMPGSPPDGDRKRPDSDGSRGSGTYGGSRPSEN